MQPIKIIEIITEEVTSPKMDGTRGSALYSVPFKLSSDPTQAWDDAFVNAWNYPASWTTSHRPGIASVVGAKIILDGTTIEEVKATHMPTLLAAVDAANEHAGLIEQQRAQEKANREEREAEHKAHIAKAASELKFD